MGSLTIAINFYTCFHYIAEVNAPVSSSKVRGSFLSQRVYNMFNCNIYDARVVERRLLDNVEDKESVFLQGNASLLLALVKKDQMRNEREVIAFTFDMSSRIDNNKDSTTTFLMSFDCLIDALWEDFDRSIAKMCFHIVSDDRSRLLQPLS